MQKIDYKKELKHLYKPSAKKAEIIEVPAMNFLMIDGKGDPNTAPAFAEAVEALYALSYALKFRVKKSSIGIDYGVMPLEALWWTEDMTTFSEEDKDAWSWTTMIMQPNLITGAMVEEAMTFGIAHDNPTITEEDKIRFDACISRDDPTVQPQGEVQVKTIEGGAYAVFLHEGAYENLGTTYDAIGDWIVESGTGVRDVPKFEKYLNRDPKRTQPENLRTEIYLPIVTGET